MKSRCHVELRVAGDLQASRGARIAAKEPGQSRKLPGLPLTRYWSKPGGVVLKVVDSNRGTEFWSRVSAGSYSGYTAICATRRGGCQCSQNHPGRSLSLLRDVGCPLET